MAVKILVVEDNKDNMALIEYLLRENGYAPLLARSGEEGVEVAVRERPDLILLDIRLPGMDGYEVAALLKQRPELSGMRIVAVTASVTTGDQARIAAAGLDGYIAKPIEPEWFMDQLEPYLALAAAPDGTGANLP